MPLVRPPAWKGDPIPDGTAAVMAATVPDVRRLCRRMGVAPDGGAPLYTGRFFRGPRSWALAGPFIGAPHAAMLVETLAHWGIRRILFFGWCGALVPSFAPGDAVLPDAGLSDEGTSRHYGVGAGLPSKPSEDLQSALVRAAAGAGLTCRRGPVCSTDAIFRETPGRLEEYRRRGAVAVDMELSAVLAAAGALSLEAGALLLVSDNVSGNRWQPGFATERFRSARMRACDALADLCESRWIPTSEKRPRPSGGG